MLYLVYTKIIIKDLAALIENRTCMAWEPGNLGWIRSLHWVAFQLQSPYLDLTKSAHVSLGPTLMLKGSIKRSTQLRQISKSNSLVLKLLSSTFISLSMILFNLHRKMVRITFLQPIRSASVHNQLWTLCINTCGVLIQAYNITHLLPLLSCRFSGSKERLLWYGNDRVYIVVVQPKNTRNLF